MPSSLNTGVRCSSTVAAPNWLLLSFLNGRNSMDFGGVESTGPVNAEISCRASVRLTSNLHLRRYHAISAYDHSHYKRYWGRKAANRYRIAKRLERPERSGEAECIPKGFLLA